jgi:hypothetical protein
MSAPSVLRPTNLSGGQSLRSIPVRACQTFLQRCARSVHTGAGLITVCGSSRDLSADAAAGRGGRRNPARAAASPAGSVGKVTADGAPALLQNRPVVRADLPRGAGAVGAGKLNRPLTGLGCMRASARHLSPVLSVLEMARPRCCACRGCRSRLWRVSCELFVHTLRPPVPRTASQQTALSASAAPRPATRPRSTFTD